MLGMLYDFFASELYPFELVINIMLFVVMINIVG